MTEYSDKMLGLRKSTKQALDEPKPAYRVMAVDPKGGNIDDQFALIESTRAYGSPASDPSMRKILVGDSLPEGEVTAITREGIQVIPDYGDEFVIPLGRRPGYKPPIKKKPPPVQMKSPIDKLFDYQEQAESLVDPDSPLYATSGVSVPYEAGAKHMTNTMKDFLDEQGFSTVPTKGTSPVDKNTEIYGDHIPGAEDMSPDELREASFDAAARQYGQKYENQQPVSESTVEFDGVEYVEEVFGDGAVFFVPTGEDGDYMRGENKEVKL